VKVLSLFDGMSCGRIALERKGLNVEAYGASEICKYAMTVAKLRWHDVSHIGDVCSVKVKDLSFVPDLLIGGSPCQGFSRAGKGLNFDDPRSKLFFEYLRVLNECRELNPNVKFLLENVEMDRWCEGVITEALNVQPLKINSALVSAQNRERLYWTNIGPRYQDLTGTYISEIPQPKDLGIVLKDIIEEGALEREKTYSIDTRRFNLLMENEELEQRAIGIRKLGNCNPSGRGMNGNIFDIEGKCPTLTTNKGEGPKIGRMVGLSISDTGIRPFTKSGGGVQEIGTIAYLNGKAMCITKEHAPKILTSQANSIVITYRKASVVECERLQNVPDGYTAGVSKSRAYEMLGNGWTVGVVAHIFGYLT
jgi:DNA-cytosine methyltransferase